MGIINKYIIIERPNNDFNNNYNKHIDKKQEFTKFIKYYLEKYGIKEYKIDDSIYYSFDFNIIDKNNIKLYFSIYYNQKANTAEVVASLGKIKTTNIDKLYEYLNYLNIKYPMLNFHYYHNNNEVYIRYNFNFEYNFIPYEQFSRILNDINLKIRSEKEFIKFLFNEENKMDYDTNLIDTRYTLIMKEIHNTLVNKECYRIKETRINPDGSQCLQLNFTNKNNICQSEINITIKNCGNNEDFDIILSCNYDNHFMNIGNRLIEIIAEINNTTLYGKFMYMANIINYTHVYHVNVNYNVNISSAINTVLSYMTEFFPIFKEFII